MSFFLKELISNYEGEDLRGNEKKLLEVLAWKADDDGNNAYPCTKEIARFVGCKQRAIFSNLKKLKSKNLITGLKISIYVPVNYSINLQKLLELKNIYRSFQHINTKSKNEFMALCQKNGLTPFKDTSQNMHEDTPQNMHAQNTREAKDTSQNMHVQKAGGVKDTSQNMHVQSAHYKPSKTISKNKQQLPSISQVSRADEIPELDVVVVQEKNKAENQNKLLVASEPLPPIPEEQEPVEQPNPEPKPEPVQPSKPPALPSKPKQFCESGAGYAPQANTEDQEPIQNEKVVSTHQVVSKIDSRSSIEVDERTAIQAVIASSFVKMSGDGQTLLVNRYSLSLDSVENFIAKHGEEKVVKQIENLAEAQGVNNPGGWLRKALEREYETATEVTPTQPKAAYHDVVDVRKYDMTLSQEERELSLEAKNLCMGSARKALRAVRPTSYAF